MDTVSDQVLEEMIRLLMDWEIYLMANWDEQMRKRLRDRVLTLLHLAQAERQRRRTADGA